MLPRFDNLLDPQILKNEGKPAVELCVEKELSGYSRFPRSKYVFGGLIILVLTHAARELPVAVD